MSLTPSMGGGMVRRSSGLYVSADTIQRTIPNTDFVKLRRLIKVAGEHLLRARFTCAECQAPVQLTREDRLVQGVDGKAGGGRIVLRCGCTTWRVR